MGGWKCRWEDPRGRSLRLRSSQLKACGKFQMAFPVRGTLLPLAALPFALAAAQSPQDAVEEGRGLSKISPIPILAQKPRSLDSLWGDSCRSNLQSAANTTTSQQMPPRAAGPTGRRLPSKSHAILPSDDSAIDPESTLNNSFTRF